jgi:hypothetical protein
MRLVLVSPMFIAIVLTTLGCGPMQRPMPVRLNDESQLKIDEAWNKALSPITKHDHQTLLDLLIMTGAYQNGVDDLTLRSTKRFQGGLVVMELHFDRLLPNNDRFVVQVLDTQGKLLRQENYGRAEIETTNNELGYEINKLKRKQETNTATGPELKKLADLEARLTLVGECFPRFEEKEEGESNRPN